MPGKNISFLIARIPPKIMLLATAVLAISAAAMVELELQKAHQQLTDAQLKSTHKDMASLLVAKTDIQEGQTISADVLSMEAVEAGRVPAGALQDTASALGLKAQTAIPKGESILSQNLKVPQVARGFATKIRSGYRAITFPVDTSTGVAGFLLPDSRVDILAQTGSGADGRVLPILSDVQVVAVGQTYQKKPGQDEAQPTSSVTVAVMPGEAQKLINAMSSGKLYCLMRNQSDHTPLAVRDTSSLFASTRPAQESEPTLTSSRTLPATPSAIPSRISPAPEISPKTDPHNVDVWFANKKDALSFPKQ